jgi:hypothetical protein
MYLYYMYLATIACLLDSDWLAGILVTLCDRTTLFTIGAQLELSVLQYGDGTASLLLFDGSWYAADRKCRLIKDDSKRHPDTRCQVRDGCKVSIGLGAEYRSKAQTELSSRPGISVRDQT